MSETIVVVGANHAGTAAINTILDHYKDKRVVVFDRGSVISFLGCGMALWIGGQISGPDGLFYASKEAFEQKGATVHTVNRILSGLLRLLYNESNDICRWFGQPAETTDRHDAQSSCSRSRMSDAGTCDLKTESFRLYRDSD